MLCYSSQSDWYCLAVRVLYLVKHPPTRDAHVMKEPVIAKQESCMTLRSMRDETINDVEERTWSLSRYSGDQL